MGKFTPMNISSLCLSVHLALNAGISVPEGVLMYREEEDDAARRAALETVSAELEIGEPLSAALRKSGAFPEYMTDMIEVGEKTGKLDDTLLSLSRYYDRQHAVSRSIRGATAYPLMMLCVMLLVLVVFLVRILPIFADVYDQLGARMSGVATASLNFGRWLRGAWIPLVAVIVVLAVAVIVFRKQCLAALKKIFMGGKLSAAMASARFSSVLSMTLAAGMDSEAALRMAARLTEDKNVAAKIEAAAASAGQGASFSQCVAATGVFSALYNRMLAVGVRTGSSDTVMEEIARRTGDEASERLESFIGKIEPALVIVMSLLVGLLLLSVMLPLAGIMSAV